MGLMDFEDVECPYCNSTVSVPVSDESLSGLLEGDFKCGESFVYLVEKNVIVNKKEVR